MNFTFTEEFDQKFEEECLGNPSCSLNLTDLFSDIDRRKRRIDKRPEVCKKNGS